MYFVPISIRYGHQHHILLSVHVSKEAPVENVALNRHGYGTEPVWDFENRTGSPYPKSEIESSCTQIPMSQGGFFNEHSHSYHEFFQFKSNWRGLRS